MSKFFSLAYGLVKWALHHSNERLSPVPCGPSPIKGLELVQQFKDRPAVFKMT